MVSFLFRRKKMILPISLLAIATSARLLNLPYKPSDSLESMNCYKYACKPSNMTFTDETCSYYNSDDSTYYLSPCESDTQACSLGEYNSTCSEVPPDPVPSYQSYPGEPCVVQSDCVYGKCNGERCVGSVLGGPCVNNYECDPGFKCNGSSCDKQIAVGDTGCQSDEDCVTNAACNVVRGLGTCIEYFSVPQGGKVSDCHEFYHISDICQTGFCTKDSVLTSFGTCVEAPVSSSEAPVPCTKNADCYGIINSSVYGGECKCGFNADAQAYCDVFIGDAAGLSYIDALTYFVRSGNLEKCNTSRRFEQACWEISKNTGAYKDTVAAGLYFNKFPELQNNADCVKNTWTKYYWGLNAMGLMAVAIALLF